MTQQRARDRNSGTNGRADTEVRIVTGLRAADQCIAWIGAKTGTFAKHGLDVTFPKLEVGGPESVAGLLRRDWDFAQNPVAQVFIEHAREVAKPLASGKGK